MLEKHTLKRIIISNKAILGIWIDSEGKEICRTLENPIRETTKDSAIPIGTYECEKDNHGKFQFYKVLNVPNRTAIEIHQGNYEKDTEGCILVGTSWAIMNNELAVTSSVKKMNEMKKILPERFLLEIC
jgi:hypothetical protein